MARSMDAQTLDRAIGLVHGLAVADMFGGPIEGMDFKTPIAERKQSMLSLKESNGFASDYQWMVGATACVAYIQTVGTGITHYMGRFNDSVMKIAETTDDLGMAVAIMRSVNDVGWFERFSLAEHFVKWGRGGAAKGMGGSTSLMLGALDPKETGLKNIPDPYVTSERVREAGSQTFVGWGIRNRYKRHGIQLQSYPNTPVASNGGEMRVPVVVYPFLSEDADINEMYEACDMTTRITHPFQECYATSRAVVFLARELILSGDKEKSLEKFYLEHGEIIVKAKAALASDRNYGGGALETFAIALKAFENGTNYEDTVLEVMNASTIHGSWATDYDTYGAVVGSWAGALYGSSSIPSEWKAPENKEGKPTPIHPVSLEELEKLAVLNMNIGFSRYESGQLLEVPRLPLRQILSPSRVLVRFRGQIS